MRKVKKKLFKHGGSYAVVLPIEFIRTIGRKREVLIEAKEDRIVIRKGNELDTIESESAFKTFIQAIAKDALSHPEKLKDKKDVWDEEWEELLEGVEAGEE